MIGDIDCRATARSAVMLVKVDIGRSGPEDSSRRSSSEFAGMDRPLPFGMVVDLERSCILSRPIEDPTESLHRVFETADDPPDTTTPIRRQDRDSRKRRIFRDYLTTLVEAWLRDLLIHWKSEDAPRSREELAGIGLARASGGGDDTEPRCHSFGRILYIETNFLMSIATGQDPDASRLLMASRRLSPIWSFPRSASWRRSRHSSQDRRSEETIQGSARIARSVSCERDTTSANAGRSVAHLEQARVDDRRALRRDRHPAVRTRSRLAGQNATMIESDSDILDDSRANATDRRSDG